MVNLQIGLKQLCPWVHGLIFYKNFFENPWWNQIYFEDFSYTLPQGKKFWPEENLADLADYVTIRQIKFPPNLNVFCIRQIKFLPTFLCSLFDYNSVYVCKFSSFLILNIIFHAGIHQIKFPPSFFCPLFDYNFNVCLQIFVIFYIRYYLSSAYLPN